MEDANTDFTSQEIIRRFDNNDNHSKSMTYTSSADKSEARSDDTRQQQLPEGTFLEIIGLIERMHRLLLDVIKDEFTREDIREINPVQAMILFNVGHNRVSAGELRSRGYYQGSNVSYNLRKLVDAGFMDYRRNPADKRSVDIGLTKVGFEIHEIVRKLWVSLLDQQLSNGSMSARDLSTLKEGLMSVENHWRSQIRFLY